MTPPNSKHWESDPEYIELMKFLIDKTKDSKSSMNVYQLARDFKETSGSSQQVSCLRDRILVFRSKIHLMDSIDTAEKVKMLVALGGSIDKDFLNELQNDAHVEVDEYKRITKYIAKDGSLELEGDHSVSAKRKLGWDRQKQIMNDFLNDSDDVSRDSIPKTPGSVKRPALKVPTSSKRTRMDGEKSENHVPDDSTGTSGTRVRELPKIQLLMQPKLEGDPGDSTAENHSEASISKNLLGVLQKLLELPEPTSPKELQSKLKMNQMTPKHPK